MGSESSHLEEYLDPQCPLSLHLIRRWPAFSWFWSIIWAAACGSPIPASRNPLLLMFLITTVLLPLNLHSAACASFHPWCLWPLTLSTISHWTLRLISLFGQENSSPFSWPGHLGWFLQRTVDRLSFFPLHLSPLLFRPQKYFRKI